MAKNFSASDARTLSQYHERTLESLLAVEQGCTRFAQGIGKAADNMAVAATIETMKTIPVEELNRSHKGFRIKTLRDGGFETVYDVFHASQARLAAINGISPEAASDLRAAAMELMNAAMEGAKISLSLDNRSPQSDALMLALSQYKLMKPHMSSCRNLRMQWEQPISQAIAQLTPATGTFKWLFSGSGKKQVAQNAYDLLEKLRTGVYGTQAAALAVVYTQATRLTPAQAWQDFAAHPIEFTNILEQFRPGLLGSTDTRYGLPEEFAVQIQNQPVDLTGLNCTLRSYQMWGVKYILHQGRVLLGDEMGLGKTVQAIAALVSRRNGGATHFVVVCPASVITNWCREVGKMSDLSVIRVHGSSRDSALGQWLEQGGVAVTTYETTGHFILPEGFTYNTLVVDEAHYVKNPNARRTRFTRTLSEKAQNVLFMTGTALENKVDEMIGLMKMLQPEVAKEVAGMAALSSAPQFREAVVPVYYRRRREDVLKELPELIENQEWCDLLPAEKAVYEAAVLEGNYVAARRVSWNVPDLAQSSKARRLAEIVSDAKEDGRKVIVFSFFLKTIEAVRTLLGDCCTEPINGSIPPQRRQEIIDDFDKAPAGTVLVAQIQSGGTGLNIQSASVVVICEPQFKPSIENQAISRAYRMGQTRNVLVYRLLCDDTVDERITALLEQKQQIFDAFADESVAASESMELDSSTFGKIMEQEAQRIQQAHQQAEQPAEAATPEQPAEAATPEQPTEAVPAEAE